MLTTMEGMFLSFQVTSPEGKCHQERRNSAKNLVLILSFFGQNPALLSPFLGNMAHYLHLSTFPISPEITVLKWISKIWSGTQTADWLSRWTFEKIWEWKNFPSQCSLNLSYCPRGWFQVAENRRNSNTIREGQCYGSSMELFQNISCHDKPNHQHAYLTDK